MSDQTPTPDADNEDMTVTPTDTNANTMMGGKKSNGHKMTCKCPICKNMMKKSKGKAQMGGKKSKKAKKSKKTRKSRKHRR